MDYQILIQSISEIVNNDLIYKEGLILTYELESSLHKKFSEHFYYKINAVGSDDDYEYTEDFEVEMGNILIRFVIKEENE